MRHDAGSIRARDPIKHVFIWPALLIVLVISIFPLIYSLTTSFMSLRLVPPIPPRFVGFGNYAETAAESAFLARGRTTTMIAFIAVALQYVIGFAVALALNASVPGEGCSASASCCRCWWRRSPWL